MSRPHIPQSVTSERKEFNPVLDRLFKNAGISTPSQPVQQNWEELDNMYQTIGMALIQVGTEVNDSVALMRKLGVEKNAEVAVSVRGLQSDLNTFTEDLVKIKARHEGFSGQIKDGEELALCLSVFQDYTTLHDRFRAVVFPVMLTMTEHLTVAMAEAKRQADLTDPNVVTDVEAKDVSTAETAENKE